MPMNDSKSENSCLDRGSSSPNNHHAPLKDVALGQYPVRVILRYRVMQVSTATVPQYWKMNTLMRNSNLAVELECASRLRLIRLIALQAQHVPGTTQVGFKRMYAAKRQPISQETNYRSHCLNCRQNIPRIKFERQLGLCCLKKIQMRSLIASCEAE